MDHIGGLLVDGVKDLAAAGHTTKHGTPYAPTAVKLMLSRRHL